MVKGKRGKKYSGKSHKEMFLIKNLEGRSFALLSIFSFIIALFVFSMNLTGNVVGRIALNDNRWMGVCFFLCGLTFTFFYLKRMISRF